MRNIAIAEAKDMEIVRRNDKNGNELDASVRLTKENCPELQEILNELYFGSNILLVDSTVTNKGYVKEDKSSTEKRTA